MRGRLLDSSAEDVEVNVPVPSPPTHAPLLSFPDGAGGTTSTTRSDEPASSQHISTPTHVALQHPTQELDRRKSTEKRPPTTARSRRPSNTNWKPARARNGSVEKEKVFPSTIIRVPPTEPTDVDKMPNLHLSARRSRSRNPWSMSLLTLAITVVGVISIFMISRSFLTRQLDPKGCRMSYMRPAFAKLEDFDTEHTRFARKYSVYLYREQMVDEDTKVKGVPVLFIPGNAGSYKQVRPIAAEAATYFHDVLRHDPAVLNAGVRSLDFFTVDFNEEFTAFHGQAILDQAEYLNDAVSYILSLYHDPRRSQRDADLPDPTSVIILGHSMGGIVARTMLVMPNYQANSINTIVTMAAPHARPPVSFDAAIVNIYEKINHYWREAYSQKWANNNPLWHVTLISVAGGGLDTMIPSDYASLESLVPETHGFTVFTSAIPTVWTGIDHEAILWCDSFRKVVVKALYDVVNVNRAAQTKPRADRMRSFKKWFLTGMETFADKTLPQKEPTTLLTLEDNSNSITKSERLVLQKLGQTRKARAHLLPIPLQDTPGARRFTLLSDQKLDHSGEGGNLEVLFCSVFPLNPGQSATLFSMNMDLSADSSGSTRLACKNAASDGILLPASTRTSKQPFYLDGEEDIKPFSYLQYDVEDIQDHQFVAVVDKAVDPTPGWVVAEFSDNRDSHRIRHLSLRRLLAFGMKINLPSNRPMVTEVKIPAMHSSLLAYVLAMSNQACGDETQLFTPFLRQYLSAPYESKFFVNVKQANINLHGIAPFMPPPLKVKNSENGISLQIWTDPTCNSSVQLSLKVDVLGSFGKLFMRYRTVLTAFPLLVVALVMRQQFRVYDETGFFMSFAEGMDACLRRSLPVMLLVLSFLSFWLSSSSVAPEASSIPPGPLGWGANGTEPAIDFKKNDLLLGSQDPFFWFLVPLMGIMSIGACVIINYAALGLLQVSCMLYGIMSATPAWIRKGDKRRSASPAFSPSSLRRRVFTTGILLFLVATFIPYQFAYLVACLVQIATCTRALRLARDTRSGVNYNFYNYAHSILIIMLWTIPAINLPILAVWVHNLAVQWFTPFSSHHNVLSIMPFILIVETLTSGNMVPQVTTRFKHVTSLCFFGIAIYAAVYGVTFAYMLHHLVNLVAAWLVAIHSSTSSWSLAALSAFWEGENADDRKRGKTP